MARPPRLAIIGLLLLALPACKVRVGGESGVSDRLREQNLELQKQVQQLEENLKLREAQVDALRQQLDAQPASVEGADEPMLTALRLDRYSGPVDTNGDGVDDLIRLYVKPVDQRGRMIPVAGEAGLRAAVLPDEAGAEPFVLAEAQVDAPQWDEAYRSSFTGTHYTLELPLPQPLPAGADEATVRLRFTQARTGATFTAQQAWRLTRD